MVWIVGIIALIVGLLIAWWIADRMCKRRFAEAEAEWNARLAAAGRWEDLAELQDNLSGGRAE